MGLFYLETDWAKMITGTNMGPQNNMQLSAPSLRTARNPFKFGRNPLKAL